MLSTDRRGRFAQNKARFARAFLILPRKCSVAAVRPAVPPASHGGATPRSAVVRGRYGQLEFNRLWHGPRRADNTYFEQPVASPAAFFVALSSSVPNAVTANNGKGTRLDTAH